mgnify:CR=1 FL=1
MLENSELLIMLDKLISNWENEIVEFKEANNDFDKDKIGQYFSAISNEANLHNLQFGWLVFGVRNKDRAIVGTKYRNAEGLMKLKQEISINTTGGLSFVEIYEVYKEIGDFRIHGNYVEKNMLLITRRVVTEQPIDWLESLPIVSVGKMEV